MHKWLMGSVAALTAVVVAVVVAAAAGVPLMPGRSDGHLGPCRSEPGGRDQSQWVVLVGENASDAELISTHRRHLKEVVLPAAAAEHGRVTIGIISADSERQPELVADFSLDPTGEGSDNPEVVEPFQSDVMSKLTECVDSALHAPPANSSDVFGAAEWGASLLTNREVVRHLVVLSDSMNTTTSCNMSGRDMRPPARDRLFADCASGDYSNLNGVEVWLAGIGLVVEGAPPGTGPSPAELIDVWSDFYSRHDATVTRAATTLLP